MTVDEKNEIRTTGLRTIELADQSGFTLVEMLIALVLSSVIFLSAYQVISNLIQYQVRARVQNDAHMDKLLLTNLLSQIIEKGIHQYDLFYRTEKKSLFQGNANSMQVISRAYSARYDKPGYRVYRLFHRDEELYVSYRAYDRNYRSNEQFQLATGLKIMELSFEYFDAGGWVDEWRDEQSIPEFIRVKINLPGSGPAEWTRRTSRR